MRRFFAKFLPQSRVYTEIEILRTKFWVNIIILGTIAIIAIYGIAYGHGLERGLSL